MATPVSTRPSRRAKQVAEERLLSAVIDEQSHSNSPMMDLEPQQLQQLHTLEPMAPVESLVEQAAELSGVPMDAMISQDLDDFDVSSRVGMMTIDTTARGRKRKQGETDTTVKKRKGKGRDGDDEGGAGDRRRRDDEGTLYDIVKNGKTALQSVVDDWIECYKQDRDSALLELIQFFIQASGCRGKITPHMYAELQHAELIRKMTEEFDEESGEYPLIQSGPMWKKFRTNFCEFVQTLVRQCQYSIIYDQYMMDNIISLLTGLTDSQVRAFRHTSTLAAMKLMSALVDVALNLSINLDNTQRQYEAERAKNQNKRANDRLEMLMAKRQELEENQEEIRNMLTYIFKGVFVHRYRDTQSDIRSICMAEIGVWMKKYPGMFLDDSYLKYVGWTLYDRTGDVRLCCLRCLSNMYESDELAPKLELFTNRFKDRIVEMTLDKDYEVAVQAVKLVINILKYSEMVLSDKDSENVYELVYSSHRQVAQAAGEFLNAKLFQKDEDNTNIMRSKKGKKRSENTPLIRDLVQFFIESELHEHGAYLVDSLWEVNDMMKDWECMTDLLLEEPGRGEEALDDRQETSLIELMVCCIKQAATGESPVGRGPNRKPTVKEAKQLTEDKARLTEHFIQTLPQLLAKYIVDHEKLANLLLIPQYFDLEIYTTSRLEKHLDSTLRYITEIIDKHSDHDVLEHCAKCYESFCCEDYPISNKCLVARNTLIDGLVERFKEVYQDFFHEEDADEDDAFALESALKKLFAFFGCHDLGPWEMWDSLFSIIRSASDNQTIPEEVVCRSISCCHMALMWSLYKLDESNPDKNAMRVLRKRLGDFMGRCQDLLYHQQDKINEEAYVSLCDLLIVFSKHIGQIAAFQPLIYDPDRNQQAVLSNFLNEKVFVDDDDDETDENIKIEELHKRRNFLAAFCKLVVYNVVNIKIAADMFKQYMRFYNDYGDIIKATLGKAREINKVTTAKTLALSLISLFKDLQDQQGCNIVDRTSELFAAIKELGRRFNLSFGLDQVKNREAVAQLHKEGILFALNPMENPEDPQGAPPNLAFLEILCEFTNKLMRQDKKTVVTYLDKHIAGGMPSTRSEDWAPLLTYRNSLVQGEQETMINPQLKTLTGKPVPPKKGVGRKRPLEVETPARFPQPLDASTGVRDPAQEPRDDEASVALTMSQMSQPSWMQPSGMDTQARTKVSAKIAKGRLGRMSISSVERPADTPEPSGGRRSGRLRASRLPSLVEDDFDMEASPAIVTSSSP